MADTPEDPDAERAGDPTGAASNAGEETDLDALRRQVEEKYDFDNFGPEDMAEMEPEEWDAAFDPDTWITGPELLDRVEADLKNSVRSRDVFARVERLTDGRVVAYSDEGYAIVEPDGSVEGFGTVLRDVKPVVALCSMEEYDVGEMPEGEVLPRPAAVPEGGSELGNNVLQVIAAVQVLAGVGLFGAWLAFVSGIISPPSQATVDQLNLTLMVVVGLAFLAVGIGLFVVVANARLSDKFRAEEYRDRLRAVGLESGERPDFLPIADDEWADPDGQLGAGDDESAENETDGDQRGLGDRVATGGADRADGDREPGDPETAS